MESVNRGIEAIEALKSEEGLSFIEGVASAMLSCFRNGGKLLIAGNGGSLCDAMHFAEELTGYFRKERPALPAIALADPGHLTCVGNDAGFDQVFSRGIEAHGNVGDLFIALTTSGNSKNLVRAVEVAKDRGLQVITFLGKTGGALKGQGDLEWIVSGFEFSDRIQEAHMAAIHIIIERVEQALFFPAEVGAAV
ncbi:D-sedoheptulose-7-phosphate isomerase [Candidatus Neptunochlamydia vexilliferae]|uniref:D-sedoheptulose-7-phosphate isomerase n=1 Tax=Candidatus Neptunichlamydia vexilliferae TaxID=1651774 RepID=UPI001E65B376